MSDATMLLSLSRWACRIAPLAAIVFLVAMADIFVSGHLESKQFFRVLPGESIAVSGELGYPGNSLSNLSYLVSSAHIRLHITATQGKLWRGRLAVGANARPGEYSLQVFVGQAPVPGAAPVYRIHVFASRQDLNASYKSLARRYLGVPDLWIVLFSSVLVIAGLAASYFLSNRQEKQLAGRNIVPIAKMARTKQGWEIHFALGRCHGIRPEDTLQLLDARFVPAGRVVVNRVEADHSTAMIPLTASIAPTYWLAKIQDQKPGQPISSR